MLSGCLLHFNELSLRHLFEYIDGKSSDSSSYTGDIGRSLKGCEKLPLVAFNSIECDLPDIDPTNLSCDHQKYLLDICTAISSGVSSSDLEKRQPGTLNLASWLTTVNRIFRLYTPTSDHSNELITLVVSKSLHTLMVPN
ncbi:hypothetical protein AVEN_157518-1 [Araneus ventricosus]|uniref:Uncharacterized protein n=1 Tax=Araneus ventricosus TaxID=182803 RepID=A0A4Y2U465_ARAVE|nr:hypothetical protein AVEN_157518-1 [Araneus ventricosus]